MTTITLDAEVKAILAELKPASMPWNDFIVVLTRCVDPKRFEKAMNAFLREDWDDAVRRAYARYQDALRHPEKLLTTEQVLAHIRRRQAKGPAVRGRHVAR